VCASVLNCQAVGQCYFHVPPALSLGTWARNNFMWGWVDTRDGLQAAEKNTTSVPVRIFRLPSHRLIAVAADLLQFRFRRSYLRTDEEWWSKGTCLVNVCLSVSPRMEIQCENAWRLDQTGLCLGDWLTDWNSIRNLRNFLYENEVRNYKYINRYGDQVAYWV
jgi:hypothetical protein